MVKRTKEIGIRKVLGASIYQIVFLLSNQFLRLVFIAGVISIPLTWWAIDEWLTGFAFRMSISPFLFIIPILATVAIASLAVSWQTIRSARSNPTEALRYE